MVLDIRTTIMIAAGLALLVGISLRYVLRDYPAAMWPSIRLWILGTVLQPTAWVLYALRDTIPDWLSMVVGNTLLSFAFAKQIQAVHVFVGQPPRRGLIYAPPVVIAALEILFTFLVPSMRWRIATASAVFCVQMLPALAVLLGGADGRRSHRLAAASFGALGGALGVRAVYEALRLEVVAHAFSATPMQTSIFALAAVFPIVATLGFVLMCSDRLNQELERQATLDALTGIANRRTLNHVAERAIGAARRHRRALAVLLIDADHFKRINDAYGHEVGDAALQRIAATLQCELRAEDVLARLGGEEFVAVLPDSDEASALRSAERLRAAVEADEFLIQQRRVPLQVSIGVAQLESGDDFAALLRRADQAMYAAKRLGRNRVVGPTDRPSRALAAESPLAG